MDLTGGLDPSRDLLLATAPEDPAMREGVSMWISDDQGRFGLPRFAVEAIAGLWDDRGIQANIAFPDGRVLVASGHGAAAPVAGADGEPRVLGAGPLAFVCEEPFDRWRMAFHGEAVATTVADQVAGRRDGPRVQVDIEVETRMAVPPWIQGEMSAAAQQALEGSDAGVFMGGDRYEQLFRCEGSFQVAGEPELTFTGTGLRIHRQGKRDTSEFRGHCWQSALFPSGRAFGYICFPPNPDGSESYNEGYVFDGERLRPARATEPPWLTTFSPHGGEVPVVLETAEGKLRVEATTHDSTFVAVGGSLFPGWLFRDGQESRVHLHYHQGGARYRWNGEEAFGMIERSLPPERTDIPVPASAR